MFDIFGRLNRLKIPLMAIAAAAAVFMLLAVLLTGNGIRKGIRIENIDVSGKSAAEARGLLAGYINDNYSGESLTLEYGGREWKYGLNDISYRFHVDDALSKAYSIGRTGNVFSKVFTAAELAIGRINLKIDTDFDRDKLKTLLENIKKEIDTGQKSASVAYKSGQIALSKDTVGLRMDVDRNQNLVENHLLERNFDKIELEVDAEKPPVSYEDIKEIDTVLSRFSTTFNAGDVNRSDNIRLACGRINGTVMMPGDEFSMNLALGPRTIENGYKEAPVIYMNELIKGPGGGICQVTTTLYDAVLLARLKIVERTHHSMPLGYVQPGQDATIAGDSLDFKFANSQDYPVSLAAEVTGNKINIRVLGRGSSSDGNTVKLESKVIAEYSPGDDEIEFDDSVPFGQTAVEKESRKGLRAVLYRDVYSPDGSLVKHEKISEDYYKPSKGLIKMNSGYYNYLKATNRFVTEPSGG